MNRTHFIIILHIKLRYLKSVPSYKITDTDYFLNRSNKSYNRILILNFSKIVHLLIHFFLVFQCVTLIIMVLEAVTVLIRQSSHFRVTRALRPLFLIDTRACGAVRRYIRQILQSLPPILDMLGLLMFFVTSYALLGYFLFSEHEKNLYFRTLGDSFVSMFVLLTTAK